MSKHPRKPALLNRLAVALPLLWLICALSAQDRPKAAAPQQAKKTRIDLLHADQVQADKQARPDVQVLVGSVKLRHEGMLMYCDTAYIFEKSNSVEAFGVMSIPTIVLVKDGKVVKQAVGARPKAEVEAMLQ